MQLSQYFPYASADVTEKLQTAVAESAKKLNNAVMIELVENILH
jgi:hypothetical protein